MKDFAGVVQMQVKSLLATLKREEAERCREISRVAEQRARKLLRAARRQSRRRMRQAIEQERQRIAAALSQANGRLRTQERRRLQACYQRRLEEGWDLLVACVQARWEDPQARGAWCDSLAVHARACFDHAPLLIEHPPDWPAEEQRRMTEALGDAADGPPKFRPDKTIASGLRVRSPQACLDGTLAGLLANRREVEAVLLAACEEEACRTSEQPGGEAHRVSGHG